MTQERGQDPLDVHVEQIGLPAEAEQDLHTIRSVREWIGEDAWGRLMRWERFGGKLLWLFTSIPLLILITLTGEVQSIGGRGMGIHLLVFLHKSRTAWDVGDWVYAAAWAAAIAATMLAVVGRLVAGAMLRRVAAHVKAPDMDTEEVLRYVEGAAFFEEMRLYAWEQKQEEHERRDDAEAQARFQEAVQRGPAWWRVELSGAHLVWWIASALILTHAYLHWPAGGVMSATWGALVSGIIFKGLVGWVGCFVVARSPQTKLAVLRYYRWWGRGIWPIVIVLMFALFGVGATGAQSV